MLVANNSHPYFTYNGVNYSDENPMSQSVANQLLAQDIVVFENPVNSFLSDSGIILSQNQYDALVADTYQRGQNIWGRESHSPLENYLKSGDFSNLDAAIAAFNYDSDASQGVQNRRIMEAEYFVTGTYTDIR